jgi:predicted RNase H-like HicB family nuclease
MTHYPAIVHKEVESCYGVSFPDLPGCTAAGATLDEAYADAIEALRFHVEGMEEDQLPVPPPSALGATDADGGALVLVPLLLPEGRSARVNVSIDRRLLGTLDAEARARGQTRSAFLAEAAERAIKG